jgi:hypothetical protein
MVPARSHFADASFWGETLMKLQRARSTALGLLAAMVAATCLMPDSAEARTRQRKHQPWQGWGDSFYLDGVRYPGGNPRGPRAWYNNWEGGFHPEVYWVLHLRSVSG